MVFEFVPQGGDLFGLLEQHRQQDHLEGQQRVALADGGDVFARGGEDAVEEILVASPQGTAEGREFGLGLV